MRRGILLAAVSALAAGCGASQHARLVPPISGAEWRAVVGDWLDNRRIDTSHRCGAVVEAVARLRILERIPTGDPTMGYRHVTFALDRYAETVCPRKPHLSKIAVGMSDAEVADTAGMPRTPRLHCWLYRTTREHDGRRVCFAHGRVTLVQQSVHG